MFHVSAIILANEFSFMNSGMSEMQKDLTVVVQLAPNVRILSLNWERKNQKILNLILHLMMTQMVMELIIIVTLIMILGSPS